MGSLKPNRYLTAFAIVSLLLLTYSCSTKKNTFVRRVFHNLTGHYNQFWNGRESYRQGVAQLENTLKDNYNKILPVYNYGTKNEAQQLNSYMDKAIEKASLNIQTHSMFFNHKEWVKWIDDSYMMIGKAYFYKHEFNLSKRTFEFITNEYKKNDIKYEATLWLAKSYNQLEKYKRAQSVLDNLRNELEKLSKPPQDVVKALPLVTANMFLKQEKYNQARESLKEALYVGQKRKTESRVRFILGQIHQQEEDYYKASEYYAKVIKMNPPYEMAFNATINLATCYDISYENSSKSIIKNLLKMLKEDKNKDYRDQIYFALSDVEFKNQEDSIAIDYLRLSVATSVTNDYQKATSSLKLGGTFFKIQSYQLSQAYYDTAVQVLPEDYPDYKNIIAKSTYLSELVNYLVIVQTQDSLQMVASMNEEERNIVIDKIIAKLIAEEEKAKEQEELLASMGDNTMAGTNQAGSTSRPMPGNQLGGGKWYFYNPGTKSYGYSEFVKKWGKRKLEDNWWLVNKKTLFVPQEEVLAENDSIVSDSTATAKVSNDPHNRDYYLKDLPFTEEQVLASNVLIDSALFELGFIYKDDLENNDRAIESFDTLVTRFPESIHLLQSYYQLFKLYSGIDSIDKAEYYKGLIIQNFPDSDYARLLTDPNYYKELEAEKNRALTLYDETYNYYLTGDYYMVYSNSDRALSTFEKPKEIMAKFEYLRALSLGKIEVTDSLQVALEGLVKKYPDSEITPLAQNILNYLAGPSDTTSATKTKEPEEIYDISIYDFNPNSKQIFAIIVKGENSNINALKVRVSDFNSKNYRLENLSITSILLDMSTNFIMAGNFSTIDKAMAYYNSITTNDYVFANIKKENIRTFIISQENYPVFYRDKDIKKYQAFFNKYYFNNQ